MRIKVILIEDPDGGYGVKISGIPGCYSQGETVEEALKNAMEAVQLHLEPIEDDYLTQEKYEIREIAV